MALFINLLVHFSIQGSLEFTLNNVFQTLKELEFTKCLKMLNIMAVFTLIYKCSWQMKNEHFRR